MVRVKLKTKDHWDILGEYNQKSNICVLLIHMMKGSRKDYTNLIEMLNKRNFSTMAIDLRAHGESLKYNGKIIDASKLSYEELIPIMGNAIYDLKIAIRYITQKGIKCIYLCGASIGANLTIQYAAKHPKISKLVLLSPGLNYYCIETEVFAKKLERNQEVLIVAGTNDIKSWREDAATMVEKIAKLIKGHKTIIKYESKMHGSDLLNRYPILISMITDWYKL